MDLNRDLLSMVRCAAMTPIRNMVIPFLSCSGSGPEREPAQFAFMISTDFCSECDLLSVISSTPELNIKSRLPSKANGLKLC